MQCNLYVVGEKMPNWCVLACDDYLTRLKHHFKCKLIEIPTALRQKSASIALCKETEGNKILQKIAPHQHVIAMDVLGKTFSTLALSKEISNWKQSGQEIVFIIGGPDGLSPACLERANERWSLSALTFPHALARVMLLEQLYRGASILANHPYHRE